MIIRTQKDVEELERKINDELGIDVKKYKDEEIFENFAELLIFPGYVFKWLVRPIFMCLALFLIGFFVLDLHNEEYLMYVIFGIPLTFSFGILTGLLILLRKMKSDIWSIADYSLNIMQSSVTDLNQVNLQIAEEDRKDVLNLLFKGVIHIVTIPVLSKVIANKVPLLGVFIEKLVIKVLNNASDNIEFDDKEFVQVESQSKLIDRYSNSIRKANNGLEKAMNFTFRIAELPLKVSFVIDLVLISLFVYWIN